MGSFNGFGTNFFGHSKVEHDESYVATEFIIVFFLPVFPLGSYRIYNSEIAENSRSFFGSSKNTKYRLKKIKLDLLQVFEVYAIVYGIIGSIIFLGWYFEI